MSDCEELYLTNKDEIAKGYYYNIKSSKKNRKKKRAITISHQMRKLAKLARIKGKIGMIIRVKNIVKIKQLLIQHIQFKHLNKRDFKHPSATL